MKKENVKVETTEHSNNENEVEEVDEMELDQEKRGTFDENKLKSVNSQVTITTSASALIEEESEYTEVAMEHTTRRMKIFQIRKRIVIGLSLAALILFVVIDSCTEKRITKGLDYVMNWVKYNPYTGIFVYILICFLCTILFVPGIVITLGGSYIFACAFSYGLGILAATFSVFTGASLGAIVSFFIGRYLCRHSVEAFAQKYTMLKAIDSALSCNGLRIMFLLRLSPIIPFNVLNYFAGVTAMSFFDNMVSLLAILPGTALFVFLGGSAGKINETSQHMREENMSGTKNNESFTIISVTIGIVFAILGIAATSFYAKRELKKVLRRRGSTCNIENTSVQNNQVKVDVPLEVVEEGNLKEEKNIVAPFCHGFSHEDPQESIQTQIIEERASLASTICSKFSAAPQVQKAWVSKRNI